jgi:inhibitor of cysteine peptidase
MRRLLVVLFWLAGISCLFAAQQKPLELTAADNGKTNSVIAGQAIVVSLKGNITTGYGWELAGIDGKSVVPVGEIKYRADAHPEGMVGAGGVFQAKFKALKPGKTTIRLKYCRPWEKNEKPAESFAITLLVER